MDFAKEHPLLVGLAATFVGLPLLVLAYFTIVQSRRTKGAPPVWTGGWPLIGNFHKFSGNPVAAIREGYDKNGPVFTMKFLNFDMTFIIGPRAETHFYDPRLGDDTLSQNEPYKFMTPVFGPGVVFDAPQERKNQQLRFVVHGFKDLKNFVPKIVREMDAYLDEKWGDSGEIDLLEAMSHVIILTASKCLLGDEVRARLFGGISELLRKLDEGINPIAIFFPNLPIPSFKTRDTARREIGEIFGKIINDRRANGGLDASGEKHDDMLQWLMDARYDDGTVLETDQITGLLLAVLFAGQHTSSITSTWTLLNLLHSPHYYRKAMAEQVALLGPDPAATSAALAFDKVDKMSELYRCVKESLRQYPPLIMLMREVKKPLKVMDYTVPVGHYVFTSPSVSMNIEAGPDACFAAPEKFDPDRYLPERAEDKKHAFAFSAFGGGRHACVGEHFGYMQVRTIVSIMLRRYEMVPLDPLPKPDYTMMVVGPKRPTRVRYRRRTGPITEAFPSF